MGVGGLPSHYSAVQLHLHWGNGVGIATGSEHTINGQSTSAEVCISNRQNRHYLGQKYIVDLHFSLDCLHKGSVEKGKMLFQEELLFLLFL